MKTKTIELSKETIGKDGDVFKFIFEGKKVGKVDSIIVKCLIDEYMQRVHHGCMPDDVSALRTMLQGYKEYYLHVFHKDNEGSEAVEYKDSHMISFEKVDKGGRGLLAEDLTISYTPEVGININVGNSSDKGFSFLNVKEEMPRAVSNVLDEICYLDSPKPIVLDDEGKVLVAVYKDFYGEYPDFSDKKIQARMNAMVSLLSQFNVTVGEYHFAGGEGNNAISIGLSNQVSKFFPLGKITESPIELNECHRKKINLIGNEIRNAIRENKDPEHALSTLSTILFVKKYLLSSSATPISIAAHSYCTPQEVEDAVKLVKKINSRIQSKR